MSRDLISVRSILLASASVVFGERPAKERPRCVFVKMESVFLLTRKGKHFPAAQEGFFL